MISGLKPKKLLYKDGTGQAQRQSHALNPESFNIDERSSGDLIRFAQQFAEHVLFYNENDSIAGNWEPLFMMDGNIESLNKDEREKLKKEWLTDMLSYIQSPSNFSANDQKLAALSKPHVVLFVAFLQLLDHARIDLNGFTKKHLDFYYLDVLGMQKKNPIPDVVNILIKPEEYYHDVIVEKGTGLSAGQDSLGNDLVYTTDRQIVVNNTTVSDIKNLYVDKKLITLQDARFNNAGSAEDGFLNLFKLALGDPGVGDDLPKFNNKAVTFSILEAIYNKIKDDVDTRGAEYNYITQKLFLEPRIFEVIIQTYKNPASSPDDWQKVYNYLDSAFKEKTKQYRQQALASLRVKENSPEAGLVSLLEFALGEPGPSDKLPFYKGRAFDLSMLRKDLSSNDELVKKGAIEYVREELLMVEKDFAVVFSAIDNGKEEDWNKLYTAVELAQRKKRKFEFKEPIIEEWINVYAVPDAKANRYKIDEADSNNNLRFSTFGKSIQPENLATIEPANIGFAVASGQLLLTEGKRTITLTLSFTKEVQVDIAAIKSLTTLLVEPPFIYQPFLVFLSHSKGWQQVVPTSVNYGNFTLKEPSAAYIANITEGKVVKSSGPDFVAKDDVGRYLVWPDGTLYLVTAVVNASTIEVQKVGETAKSNVPKKYNASDIYFNSLQLVLTLGDNDEPVTAPGVPNSYINIQSDLPVVAIVLNQVPLLQDGKIVTEKYQAAHKNLYQQFKNLQLEKVRIQIQVAGLKTAMLQNDVSVLDSKKPFEIFGGSPDAGSRFYFTHPELATRKLDSLGLTFEWMKPPKMFAEYYKNYWEIIKSGKDLKALYDNYQVTSNSTFEAALNLLDKGVRVPLGKASLFNREDAAKEQSLRFDVKETLAAKRDYNYVDVASFAANDEVLDTERYFELELGSPDFQHSIYPTLLTTQAMLDPLTPTAGGAATPNPLRALTLNAPYTPKLKSFTTWYAASLEINFTTGFTSSPAAAFHINAFGYKQLSLTGNTSSSRSYFLPYLKNEGELYLGLHGMNPPQNLSLLFQMAEGSADPDIAKQPVKWSYLSDNEWKELPETSLLADATNGLVNTGIMEFNVPGDATNNNTLFQKGFHWLKASVRNNITSISDTVDILAQGVSATFTNNNNSSTHFEKVLAPDSISETVERIPGIEKIIQPFSSAKGRPAETDQLFYNRVSERLRHKSRALTMWDYERLVLEEFPSVYKVKCIPSQSDDPSAEPGQVDVVVIPDIKGKLPFNPFQPKVPTETILQIQQYLEQRTTAFTIVKVKNPSYLQVQVRTAVKFKTGYNEGFYTRQLEDELKKYLAPWAYDKGSDILIGGRIYANVIVSFLAERPYIEYVAGIKLFESRDGISFIDSRILNNGESAIRAASPDMILVSALKHYVDLITEDGFEENDFTGINYMRIGLDFVVG